MSDVVNIWGLPGGASIYSNISSYSWGISSTAVGHYSSHVRSNQAVFTRSTDKYSPLLYQMLFNGDLLDYIKITLSRNGAKINILFTDSTLSNLATSNSSGYETISFEFDSMSIEY